MDTRAIAFLEMHIVTMPYYDINGGGVEVDDTYKIASARSNQYTPNDGSCMVWDNGQAESHGFVGETTDTQWLASDVTLTRGDIKPGITKELTSKTYQTGETIQNPVSAAPTDILNWTIKTENDGSNSISDYVLTDRMQAPYMFTGTVSYMVYTNSGSTIQVARPDQDYLFAIAKGEQEGTLTITTNQGNTSTLTVGGDPIKVSCKWYYSIKAGVTNDVIHNKIADMELSIMKDDSGNAVMSIHFLDETMAIPENGSSKLTLSTYNEGNTMENKQFVNTCFITPLVQTWDNTTSKGNMTTLETPFSDTEQPTVRNSASIATSYGFVTGALKRVTEVKDPDNTAASTDETNYIVLDETANLFHYTVSVNNSTPKAMEKLVLIDGLPEVGDHTAFLDDDFRFSEFKVSLADDPDFKVTVTDKDGNTTTLGPGNYTIEYSEKKEFTSEDWAGTSTWSDSKEGARAIRLIINDSTGALIPAESTISLDFTCKIDDPNVQPGQIAWNSFGYHCRLLGEALDLEAAPLKVGVKTPSVPELRKQVVDYSGQPSTVKKDETFCFLVYPGNALNGEYTTEQEWTEVLKNANTPYEKISVTVKAGESLSESVRLQTDQWKWTNGRDQFASSACSGTSSRESGKHAGYTRDGGCSADRTDDYDSCCGDTCIDFSAGVSAYSEEAQSISRR